MFRSAATKIAHNSTLPALGGNKELRPLQDLITAEKNCMTSIQHMSTEFGKSAEALRTWGAGEGDDLGDTLTSCTTLLVAFSNALASYASAHNVIRASMKTIRSSEETLEELKRRRKSLHAKADAAERKLSKMNPEHKSLPAQTDILNRLREEIRTVEGDILEGETRLWDDKRRSVRMWMGVKWTGMGEFCEKGLIAAEYGRSIIAEIPESFTQPGMIREPYHGHQRTQTLVAEAQHGIEGVGAPGSNFTRPSITQEPSYHQSTQLPPLPLVYNGNDLELRYQGDQVPQSPHGTSGSLDLRGPPAGPLSHQITGDTPPISPQTSYASGPHPPFSYPMPAPQPSYPIGTPQANSTFLSHPDQTLGSGHFIDPSDFSSTFPTPNVGAGSQRGASVDDFGVGLGGPPAAGPGPSGGRFATFPVKSRSGMGQPSGNEKPTDSNLLNPNPWDAEQELYNSGAGKRASMVSDVSSIGLAYDRSDSGVPGDHGDDRSGSENKHVRFGAVSDVDEEMQRRYQQQQPYAQEAGPIPHVLPSPSPTTPLPGSITTHTPPPAVEPPRSTSDGTKSKDIVLGMPKSPLEPPPAYQYPDPSSQDRAPSPPIDPREEERQLNAAAAREVSREFDSLTFSPPMNSDSGQMNLGLPSRSSPVSFDRAMGNMGVPGSFDTAPADVNTPSLSPSPLLPPKPAFAGRDRSVSPGIPPKRPTVDVSTNVQPATPLSSPFDLGRASPTTGPPHQSTSSPLTSSPKTELPPIPTQSLGIPGRGHNNNDSPDSRDDSSFRTASPAYRTPPEYYSPRLGSRSASGSVSAGSTPLPSPAPGTKTISAAAFRRPPPRKMSGDTLNSPPFAGGLGGNTMAGAGAYVDTSPLVLKKRTPGSVSQSGALRTPSPGLGDRASGPMAGVGAGGRNASGSVSSVGGYVNQSPHSHLHHQAHPPPQPVSGQDGGDEDQFDYISAYVNSAGSTNDQSGSPRTEFGRLGRAPGQDVGTGGDTGYQHRAPPGGYDQGRFATNLEDESGGLR